MQIQYVVASCAIEASKQNTALYVYNKTYNQRNPSRSDFFLKSERIQIVFQ